MIRAIEHFSRISTRFGDPVKGSQFGKHLGTDYACAIGTSVRSTVPGVVKSVTTGAVGGLTIEIYGDDGRSWRYLHLSQANVRAGQRVNEGQEIAKSGNSGQVTGPHCHVDVRKGGTTWSASFSNYYDPEALLQDAHRETVKNPTTWNVRTGPAITETVIGTVRQGEEYDTEVLSSGWRKITFKGKVGYVGPAAWR